MQKDQDPSLIPDTSSTARRRPKILNIFNYKSRVLKLWISHVNISDLIIAIVSASLGAYFSYLFTARQANSDDQIAAEQIKKAVSVECVHLESGFAYMIQISKESGMIGFNSYAMPRFPDNLRDQINHISHYFLAKDPDFVSIINSVDAADYKTTMSMRSDDGSISGSVLSNYAHAIDNICKWAADTKGSYIVTSPFDN